MFLTDEIFQLPKDRVATLVFQHPHEVQHVRGRVLAVEATTVRLGPVDLVPGTSYEHMNHGLMRHRVVDVIEIDGVKGSLRERVAGR